MLEATLEWGETWRAAKAGGDVQTWSAAKHRVLLCWYAWSRAISSDRFILPPIPPAAGLHIFSIE